MKFFKRKQPPEQRSARSDAEILSILDGNGIDDSVEVSSVDSALRQATVNACVWIVSETIAQLPIYVQERTGLNTWQAVMDHDALGLLASPNSWQTQHEFIAYLISWMELRGNGYCIKQSGMTGPPKILIPIRGDQVEVKRNDDYSLTYKYKGEPLPQSQILHLRNAGVESYIGDSTIKNHRRTFGLALAMQQHGAGVFKHGASVGKYVYAPTPMTDEAYDRLKESIKDKYSGFRNAHKTMILEGGLEMKSVGMNNNDSQWIEAQRFNTSQIATIFHVPDFMLNSTEKSTTWGSGLEQLSRAFVRHSLQPRMSRIAQMLNRELLQPGERQKYRFAFDTDSITMGEYESRMTGHGRAIQWGIMSPNEVREIEGKNPRDGGSEYLKPMNMTTGEDDELQKGNPTI